MIKEDKFMDLFEDELRKNLLKIKSKIEEDVFIIEINDIDVTITLKNTRKDFERDNNEQIIRTFVKNIKNAINEIPEFEVVKKYLRFSIEQNELLTDSFIYEPISKKVSKVLVFVSHDEELINWVTESHLMQWDKKKEELYKIADENMNELLNEFELEVTKVENMNIAMIPLEKDAFKSAVITSSKFNEKISKDLEFPIFALIPTRDFILIFSKKDKELLNRVGNVIVKEYNESGYPLSKEVFEINSNGINAIGSF